MGDLKLEDKWELLIGNLKKMGSAAVAFSGGVDSTFLLYAAHEALGDDVLAVTVQCDWVPMRETAESEDFCKTYGIRQEVLHVCQEDVDGFAGNPPERCYLCKKALFTKMKELAKARGMACVLDGSNVDDLSDYRPGMRALRELGIVSALQDASLHKAEIRELSRKYGLATWQKPSFACLASRFVYGETITSEKLRMVDRAEQKLMELGFHQFRVRMHGKMARIELLSEELGRLLDAQLRREVTSYLKELGFSYVALDLEGYRTGSMNETGLTNDAFSG